jgi:hypothetical protein
MADRLDATVIEAAGGVVECDTPDGRCIAVIYRERYGPEWTLPKGKRQAGESWQQTALREVQEETGFRARITGVAGATAYLAGGIPKARFVLAYARRRQSAVVHTERGSEATRMAGAAGRDGTSHSSGGSQYRPDCYGFDQPAIERRVLGRPARTFVPLLHRRAWKRLRSSIAAYRAELKGRAPQRTDLTGIEEALVCAERLLAAGDIDGGWKCFLTAQRLALLICPDGERAAIAKEHASRGRQARCLAADCGA